MTETLSDFLSVTGLLTLLVTLFVTLFVALFVTLLVTLFDLPRDSDFFADLGCSLFSGSMVLDLSDLTSTSTLTGFGFACSLGYGFFSLTLSYF